jgi:hypothetical protein
MWKRLEVLMAKLIGWECDKCNAQIKNDALPESWAKIHVEYLDQRAAEQLIWCNSCLANLKNPVALWVPEPYKEQYNVVPQHAQSAVQHLTSRGVMYSRAPLTAEQLLTYDAPVVAQSVPVENPPE